MPHGSNWYTEGRVMLVGWSDEIDASPARADTVERAAVRVIRSLLAAGDVPRLSAATSARFPAVLLTDHTPQPA